MKKQLQESMIKLTKELSENNIIYEEKGYFSGFNKTSMKRVGNIVKCGDKWLYKTFYKEGKEMSKKERCLLWSQNSNTCFSKVES